jgi:hypothetical protein
VSGVAGNFATQVGTSNQNDDTISEVQKRLGTYYIIISYSVIELKEIHNIFFAKPVAARPVAAHRLTFSWATQTLCVQKQERRHYLSLICPFAASREVFFSKCGSTSVPGLLVTDLKSRYCWRISLVEAQVLG